MLRISEKEMIDTAKENRKRFITGDRQGSLQADKHYACQRNHRKTRQTLDIKRHSNYRMLVLVQKGGLQSVKRQADTDRRGKMRNY